MTMEHPADVLTDLIGVLGDVLRVKPEKIDPEQTFQSMGLDSLLVVEFVAVVNSRYGLRVRATDLYDFPSPVSFAREVARAASSVAAAPVPVAAAPAVAAGYETPVAAAPAVAVSAPAPAPASAPAPAVRQSPAAAAATRIAEVLREQLAGILCCDPWEINTTAAFNVLGVDSMVGAEFIAVVNRSFGLRERSVLLYEHPNLAAMAAYIATRTGAAAQAVQEARMAQAAQVTQVARAGRDFAPAPRTPEPAFRPAAAPAVPAVSAVPAATDPAPAVRPLPAGDLDVLLDAIRDDRLTVDEALVLLGRRG
ncbi:acyl carrier protein [Streptomyces sp. 2132.2]|uniref:phosphopantetheine-binding protein n=1 Tax=Streptomyces sp. 2132.2 TaxID=2485161 RepID=UPI000F97C216|nr:phosphopantetheine-binding protein [Streptomyces sp. 2132.2]ROQ88759.1 acyl carrier protein [Streptomyces sp. 2132.2]